MTARVSFSKIMRARAAREQKVMIAAKFDWKHADKEGAVIQIDGCYERGEAARLVRVFLDHELLPTQQSGAQLIAAERDKQLENWTAEHDDNHTSGELAIAAAALAVSTCDAEVSDSHEFLDENGRDPWGLVAKYPDEVARLTIAGALIAAEIDRIKRQRAKNGNDKGHP